jgi:hypothetical protein
VLKPVIKKAKVHQFNEYFIKRDEVVRNRTKELFAQLCEKVGILNKHFLNVQLKKRRR